MKLKFNIQGLSELAGYIAHRTNMTLKCIQCKSFIFHNRKLEVDSCNRPDLIYLKHLDRGGLQWLKKFLVEIHSPAKKTEH
jgi:hypothetical protein